MLLTDFAAMLAHLETVQGTHETRCAFARDIIKESLRFKRRKLADLLEDYLKKLLEEGKGVVINHRLHHNGARIT